mgnify:CR=1 FL=1
MTASGGAMVLIVLALSWVIGNRIARPLKQATAVAEGIAKAKEAAPSYAVIDLRLGDGGALLLGRLPNCLHHFRRL